MDSLYLVFNGYTVIIRLPSFLHHPIHIHTIICTHSYEEYYHGQTRNSNTVIVVLWWLGLLFVVFCNSWGMVGHIQSNSSFIHCLDTQTDRYTQCASTLTRKISCYNYVRCTHNDSQSVLFMMV